MYEPKKDRHLKKRPTIRLTSEAFEMLEQLKIRMSVPRNIACEVCIRLQFEKEFKQ